MSNMSVHVDVQNNDKFLFRYLWGSTAKAAHEKKLLVGSLTQEDMAAR